LEKSGGFAQSPQRKSGGYSQSGSPARKPTSLSAKLSVALGKHCINVSGHLTVQESPTNHEKFQVTTVNTVFDQYTCPRTLEIYQTVVERNSKFFLVAEEQ
jgi:hypothetical protein